MADFRHTPKAIAATGSLKRPLLCSIFHQCKCRLDASEGERQARIKNFTFENIISFEAAYTHVRRSYDSETGIYRAIAIAKIENLDVLDILTADAVIAQLTFECCSRDYPRTHPRMVPWGSTLVNLRIRGRALEDKLPAEFLVDLDQGEPYEVWRARSRRQELLEVAGSPKIRVPEFGYITLCKWLGQPDDHRLTMLHLELGSPVEGDVALATASGSGSVGGGGSE